MFFAVRYMFRGLLWRAAAILSVLVLTASCTEHAPYPHAVITRDAFDFSRLTEGAVVTHGFSMYNTGTAPLRIQGIVPSCRCMFARVPDRVVAPGGRITMSVRLDTSGLSGPVYGRVVVYTNDPADRLLFFTVRASVESAYSLEPPDVDFGTVSGRGPAVRDMAFSSTALRLTAATSSSPYLKVSLIPRGGNASDVRVRLARDMPGGLLSGSVLLYTGSHDRPAIEAGVKAEKASWLRANPGKIFAGIVLKGRRSSSFSFYVYSRHRKPFVIKDMRDSGGYLDISRQRLAKDVYKVDLHARPFGAAGEYRSDILISTDRRRAPALQVPFRIIVMDR